MLTWNMAANTVILVSKRATVTLHGADPMQTARQAKPVDPVAALKSPQITGSTLEIATMFACDTIASAPSQHSNTN